MNLVICGHHARDAEKRADASARSLRPGREAAVGAFMGERALQAGWIIDCAATGGPVMPAEDAAPAMLKCSTCDYGVPRSSRGPDRALYPWRTIPLNVEGNMERSSRLLPLAQMSLRGLAATNAAGHAETADLAPFEAPAVILHRPSRMPTQSGPAPLHWVLRIDPRHPYLREPLMGWISDTDPDRQIELRFPSREAGLRYCRQRGWQPIVLPAQEREPVLKSYAERFVSKRKSGSGPGHEARTDDPRTGIEPLDEALIGSFPASDPPPLWAGRIGPPSRSDDAAA